MRRRYIEPKPIADLERVLGYQFKNKDLIRQALTHTSAISEKHPMAFDRDLSLLAHVGDSALKYAVTRYIFLNGKPEVLGNVAKFHEGVQAVIPNRVLATIGQETVHLEEYLIRGNSHQTLSTNMYADCMEAIFGAISIDCGSNEQEVLFRIIEKLCANRYENWLVPTATVRFASALRNHENELVIVDYYDYSRLQMESMDHFNERSSSSDEDFRKKIILWFFAIVGFVAIFLVIYRIVYFYNSDEYWNFRHKPIPTPKTCRAFTLGSSWSLSVSWCRPLE